MEEALDDLGSLVAQHPFELVDVSVALAPHLLRHESLHPHHQHVFVVTAVEHADLTIAWARGVDAPQVVLLGLSAPWHLEAGDADACRVEARQDRANRAVLAGCIAGLQHQQHATSGLGRQPLLQLVELQLHVFELGCSCFLAPTELAARVTLAELERLRFRHPEVGNSIGSHGGTVVQSTTNGQCRHPLSQQ